MVIKKLAESSGTVAFEENGKLTLAQKPSQWTSTFLYVAWLLTIITVMNIIPVLMRPSIKMTTPIFVLGGLGLAFLIVALLVTRHKNKIDSIPLHQLQVICVIDFNSGMLYNEKLQPFSPVSEAKLKRAWQLTSSSPSLSIVTPGGTLKLVKGNPFTGGISEIERLLLNRGIRK